MKDKIAYRIINDIYDSILKGNHFGNIPVNQGFGYSIFRKSNQKIERFGIVGTYRYEKFKTEHLGARISFLPLESIVSPILVSNGLMGDSILEELPATISFSTANDFLVANKDALTTFALERLPIVIEKETDIDIFIQAHIDFYFQFIEPFFNSWRDIRDLLPLIENITPKMAFNLLGSGAVFKRLTIWKLCNHPEYEKRINERIKQFSESQKNNPGEIQFERFLTSAIQLSEVLSKTEPLYNWDPAYLIPKES